MVDHLEVQTVATRAANWDWNWVDMKVLHLAASKVDKTVDMMDRRLAAKMVCQLVV